MSNASDFIIENGVLKKYVGPGGDVVIPEGVEKIESSAFENCKKLKHITIPEGVTKIGYCAFKSCAALESVNIPYSVVDIDSNAFSYCGKLTMLTVPNPDAFVHGGFDGCKSLSYIRGSEKMAENALWFSSPAMKATLCYGYLCSDDSNTAYDSGCKRSKKKVISLITKDDNAEAMGRFLALYKKPLPIDDLDELIETSSGQTKLTAFLLDYKKQHYSEQQVNTNSEENAEKELGLKERTLKEWRKLFGLSVGDTISIFKYKGNSPIVYIPAYIEGKAVTEIGAGSFSGRKDITEVHIPSSVSYVSWYAFEGCTGIVDLTIPEGVTNLGLMAFQDCTSLETVRLPATLTLIQSLVFSGCSSLEQVIFTGAQSISIEKDSFVKCPKLTIHAPAGSYAEQYAKENNIPFVAE